MVRAPRPPANNALAPLRTRGQRLPRVPGPPAARKPAQIPTVSLSRADSRRALDAEEARWADALGVWWRAERQSRQGQGWRAEEYASPATHSRPQYSEPPADIGPVLPRAKCKQECIRHPALLPHRGHAHTLRSALIVS